MLEKVQRGRGSCRRGWVASAAISLLSLSACEVPDNFWVNLTTNAANSFVGAGVNSVAEQVFGTTGSAGGTVDMGGEEEEGDHGH
jgi:hypothetical protein